MAVIVNRQIHHFQIITAVILKLIQKVLIHITPDYESSL